MMICVAGRGRCRVGIGGGSEPAACPFVTCVISIF